VGQSKMSLPIAFEALLLVPRLRRAAREWRTEETAGGGRRIRWRFQRRPRPKDAGFESSPAGGRDGGSAAGAGSASQPDPNLRPP
jgi:hypothetical protein